MEIQGTTRLIAVFGDPIAHSLSPCMHNAALTHYQLDLAYVPLHVRRDDLKSAVQALRQFNFLGANVTVPHKQAIIPFLDEVSDISKMMGAVNTVVNINGRLTGTTTDPEGFLMGFRESGQSFESKSIAIFGNGGSARTIAFALLTQDSPKKITIIGRDKNKVQALVAEINLAMTHSVFKAKAAEIKLAAMALTDYPNYKNDFEILVNTTILGMHPNTETSPITPENLVSEQVVYDIVYVPEKTQLIRNAELIGLKTVGGLGMLVYQGIASFKLWTGIAPKADMFFNAARHNLAKRQDKDIQKLNPAKSNSSLNPGTGPSL